MIIKNKIKENSYKLIIIFNHTKNRSKKYFSFGLVLCSFALSLSLYLSVSRHPSLVVCSVLFRFCLITKLYGMLATDTIFGTRSPSLLLHALLQWAALIITLSARLADYIVDCCCFWVICIKDS